MKNKTSYDIGNEFESRWRKRLAEVEGRAHLTIASGSIFNDHDVRSSIHVCQCKSTTVPKRSVSIPLGEFDSLMQLARSEWRSDGIGRKIGLYVNELVDGRVLVTLDADIYLDIINELIDYRNELDEIRRELDSGE